MKRYRLYIDESGDHTYKDITRPAKRYLGLTGCFIETEAYRTQFHPTLEALKQDHFPHSPDEPVILHRTDLINHQGPFWRLRDEIARQRFEQDLLDFMQSQHYILVTVVIDKKRHIERYREAAFHPYHFCLALLLERYCGFLNFFHAEGDVMAESRGGTEDKRLKVAYRGIFQHGTQFHKPSFFQGVLTSKEIKLKKKEANIAGLQLADLLAYPSKQDILIAKGKIADPGDVFGRKVCCCIEAKYNRHCFDGRVWGYGKVFLD